jgi:subfamily B ATP-binding cassette protein MsbA
LAHASSRVLIGRLVRGYLKPHTGRLAVAVVCMMAVALCTALFAHLIEPLFDDVFAARNARMLVLIPAFIIGIYLVKGVAEYTQNFLMEFIGQRVVADLQRDLYRHVVYQDLAFFHRHTTPSLTARFLFDLHRLRQAFSQAITGSMRDVTMIIGLTINLVDKDWVLALLALTVFPLVVYPVTRLGRRTRRYAAGTQERTGSLNLLLQETFAYNRQVKAYTMEEREIQRSEQSINDVFGLMMKAGGVVADDGAFGRRVVRGGYFVRRFAGDCGQPDPRGVHVVPDVGAAHVPPHQGPDQPQQYRAGRAGRRSAHL